MPKPKTPKAPLRPKILTPQQQSRLLDVFSRVENRRERTLILLVLKTGLKSGEACRLNVSDVFKSSEIVSTLKVRADIATNQSARCLPLSDDLQNVIGVFLSWKRDSGESLEPDAPLFCTTRTKKRLALRDFQRIMEKASAILGERITANDLRHTFGSELYQKTGDVETVRNALGLTSVKGAQVYAQSPSKDRDSRNGVEELPDVEKESDIKFPTHDIDEVSIEGTLLTLDDTTPHVAVVVQVLRLSRSGAVTPLALDGRGAGGEGEPTVVATTLSDETGKYQFINLKQGRYQVRCYTLDGYVYYQDGELLHVERGKALSNIDFHFPSFKKGTWRYYTVAEGLASMVVNTIYQDSEGVLWFGTEDGVSRYDGKEFVNFTTEDGLAGNGVYAIHNDSNDGMWFGTNGGVSRYDGKEFVNFTTADGLVDNRVYAIHGNPDGVLWFGTAGGVSRYAKSNARLRLSDGKTFKNFTTADGLADDIVQTIHRDSHGMMWFGTGRLSGPSWTGGHGVSRYDGKTFVNFTTKDGLVDNKITAIQSDSNGVMWFSTWEGVSRYDGKEFTNLTVQDGLVNNQVIAIHSDSDGVMWFATWEGVSRYDGTGFVNFTEVDGLPDEMVYAIHRDPDGVMWFGTQFGGVSRYDEQTFVTLTTADGLAQNFVQAIHSDPDGVMWLGTGDGLSRYDGREFITFTTSDGLADNRVSAIHRQPDGTLWVGTGHFPAWDGGGVSRYDGKTFLNFTTEDGLAGNGVYAIYRDPNDLIWFGTDNGVSRYAGNNARLRLSAKPNARLRLSDGKEFLNFTTKDGLAQNRLSAIHRDPDGVMWFGTVYGSGGVSRYDGKTFVNFTRKDGLADNNVWAIDGAPDGTVWFGTEHGVSRYNGKEFINFTQKGELVGNWVTAIHRTADGVVWFGTQGGGVSGYDGVAWTSLDKRDGLAYNRVFAIDSDSDGVLWFGTDRGLTRYRRCSTPPLAHIVSITTDQTYVFGRKSRGFPKEKGDSDLSTIPPFTVGTCVTVEYNAIDFKTLPEKRQYRVAIVETRHVSLQKDATDWLPLTKSTTFDHTFDKPGAYTIAVQAIDRDLNYSEPAVLSLTIQPDPVLVSMQAELNYLRRAAGTKYHFENIIGRSAGIGQVRALMERAIDSGLTVLITGETGTGKELVAKAIHYNSPRKEHPLLDRNCGAIPKELLASALFGHRKGAFTGANEDKIGLFEAASGGTVLLDEIGEMPQDAQIHLLRVLEERKVQRLGEHVSRDVDVRIIAMTNRDPVREVLDGQFREDLYYRLSEFPIHIPSLRERPEDIPLLAEHFLQEIDRELDGFAPDVFEMLASYSWPGNVRELRNVVRRAAAFVEEGEQIRTYHFPPDITQGESLIQELLSERRGLSAAVERLQRRLVENALQEYGGNRTQAAQMLEIHRSALVRLMKRLGIK